MDTDSPAIPIGIAVVVHNGSYLVGTRGPDTPLAGCDEFPGGKCLPGESPEACVERECREETSLEVVAERRLLNCTFDYPHGRVDLHFWLCRLVREDDAAQSPPAFRWVPASELAALNFPPANRELIALLTGDVED